jgi:hypothetical protein
MLSDSLRQIVLRFPDEHQDAASLLERGLVPERAEAKRSRLKRDLDLGARVEAEVVAQLLGYHHAAEAVDSRLHRSRRSPLIDGN